MYPYSIDAIGINTAPDTLAFRATLGGELYTASVSIHPKITGSWVTTQSFSDNTSTFVFIQDFTTFVDASLEMGDQLVVVDKDAPQTFYFHFEDSESNIINVTGSKITDKDLENASGEEINSFFTVEPTSSYIGNPDAETEEEKAERESLENSARSSSADSDDTEEKPSDSPEKVELASNENYKWYSSIEESKPITSFSEFKMIKESLLLETVEANLPILFCHQMRSEN